MLPGSIAQIIHRLLPNGSNPGKGRSLLKCPAWPPDLFAVAAMILENSSSYADRAFTAGWGASEYIFDDNYLKEVTTTGRNWARTGTVPANLQRLWRTLLNFGDVEVAANSLPIVVRLLAIADESCAGVGFGLPEHREKSERTDVFRTIVLEQLSELVAERTPSLLPYMPSSLCRMISDRILCVQPKTNTPMVGCTIRSLTHNLALLPSVGIVATSWWFAHPNEHKQRPFNLLLIPYPFVIAANDFIATSDCVDNQNRFFTFRAGWFDQAGVQVSSAQIADAISGLVTAAQRETENVHGVVMPETALLDEQADEVAAHLAKRHKELELFISGTAGSEVGASGPRSSAYTARLHRGEVLTAWRQHKHHRWCLENGQITRYHLGSVLDPTKLWWEQIDVMDRSCAFTVVRPGASLAVLVCEDLARFDPVLPVINAVGPNLVIALLLDGPQLERRWPGRYATVLADDPGSSVLTLTCLGMIQRSTMPGDTNQKQIALWKEAGGVARELKLRPGDHALLISLTTTAEKQVTLDRRDDHSMTRRFRLSGAQGVRFETKDVPKWLRLD